MPITDHINRLCLDDVRKSLNKETGMKKKEIDEYLDKLSDLIDEKRQIRLEPKARAYKRSVEDLIEQEREKSKLARKRHYLRVLKLKEAQKVIDGFATTGRKDAGIGMMANIGGVQGAVPGGRLSAAASEKASINLVRGRLLNGIKRLDDNALSTFKDIRKDQELFKEVEKPGSSNDPLIQKIGKLITDVFEEFRLLINAEGGDIGKIDGYTGRQVHQIDKLMSPTGNTAKDVKLRLKILQNKKEDESIQDLMLDIAYNRWRDFTKPLLDFDKTFPGATDKQIDKALRSTFNNLIEGHLTRPFVTDEMTGKQFRTPSPGNFADRRAKARVLNFKKDGNSAYQYMLNYGSGSFTKNVIKTAERMGSDYGIMKKMSDNPLAFFHQLKRYVLDNYSKQQPTKNITKSINQAEIQLGHLLHQFSRPNKSLGGKLFSNMMAFKAMADLGLVVPKSLQDIATGASKLQEYGNSYLQTYNEYLKHIFDKGTKEQNKMIADMVHAWSHSMMSDVVARTQAVDNSFGKLSQAQRLYYSLNGLNAWDNMNRSALVGALARSLGRMRKTSFENLPKQVQINLKNYGINENDWDLTRTNQINVPLINDVIVPDISRVIPDHQIKAVLGVKRLTNKAAETFRKDLNYKWSTFFQNELDDANIQPGVATMAALLGKSDPETWRGKLLRMLAMFKYFGVESTKRTLGRIIYGKGNRSIADALKNGKGTKIQLFNFMANSMVLAYIGEATANALNNRTPPSISDPKTMFDLMLSSGGFGYYGSTLAHDYSAYDSSFVAQQAGPIGDLLNNIAKIYSQAKNDAFTGDFSNIKTSVQNIIENNMLGMNLPYIKLPVDFLFNYALLEHLNPGYLERQQQKLQEKGQNFIIQPRSLIGG